MEQPEPIPMEIERRFLVTDAGFLEGRAGRRQVQGYLSRDPERTVRLRVEVDEAGAERGWLTVKGPTRLECGACVRREWEVELPAGQARAGLSLCLPRLVEKTRVVVEHAGQHWTVDQFHGCLQGLVLAELELRRPDDPVHLPPWLGPEISDDPRWSNAALSLLAAPPGGG